ELKQGIFNDTQDNNQKIISIRGKLDNKTNTRKSTTLFQDKESKEYILAIRDTELKQGIFNDIAEADVSLALNSLPNHQYIDMLRNLL
ncbi:lipase, partial [Helicobacter sp. MIT 14-3879]